MLEPVYCIILNHNNEEVIKPLYESIIKSDDYPAYLIFIDNGSYLDKSREFLKGICTGTPYNTYIQLPYNIGTTKAWNIGIRHCMDRGAKYICLINSDITVRENWLASMVRVFKEKDNVGMVSNQLRDPANLDFVQNDGPAVKNPFHYRMGFLSEKKFKPYQEPKQVQWGHMGCTLFDTKVFREIGLFDENFFVYSSDFDIQIRLKMAGFDIWHCPESIAYHKTFTTCNQIKKNPEIAKLMDQDSNIFHAKWSKEIIYQFRQYLNYWKCNKEELEKIYPGKNLEVEEII